MVTWWNAYDTQICVWGELSTQICVSHAFHDLCMTLRMSDILLNWMMISLECSLVNGDVIGQPKKVTNMPDWIMPINRLMWPRKGTISLKQGAAGMVVPSLTGAGAKTIHVADLQSVPMGWKFCLEENAQTILKSTICIRNNYELSCSSVCHSLVFPVPQENPVYIWKRSLTQRTLVEWLNSIFLCISMVNEHWCGIRAQKYMLRKYGEERTKFTAIHADLRRLLTTHADLRIMHISVTFHLPANWYPLN